MRREWKEHKYIRKEGNRYIYPEDLKKSSRQGGKLVSTMRDANGNLVKVRGSSATNTIANTSNRYDRSSGERMSPSEYKTRQQDGSLDRMRGQTIQEAAKKQGQYSMNMMRQEKAAQQVQRPVQKQTMVSTPANLSKRTTSQNGTVSTAASQAMARAGYNGPIKRPQNQNVKSVQKKVETKETKTPDKTTKTTTSTLTTTDDDKKKTTTTKNTSTSSGTSSSGSSKTSSSSSSSSGTTKSSGSGSRSGGGSVSKSSGIGGYSGAKSSSSKSSYKASSGGSSGGSSNADAEEAAEIKEKLANRDLDIDSLSKSAIDILSDSLGGLLDSGKIQTKSKGTLKLEDSKDFVKMGLSILKKFNK